MSKKRRRRLSSAERRWVTDQYAAAREALRRRSDPYGEDVDFGRRLVAGFGLLESEVGSDIDPTPPELTEYSPAQYGQRCRWLGCTK